jgi:RNA polymerase sigma-70 factor (ECF subfamily)
LTENNSEFSTRIDELIPRLRRYARALTGERNAADDLVQDTLERAWTKLHLWRGGSDLRAWLFTIMHNVHVNQVRSRGASPTLPLDDDMPDAPVRPTQSDMLEVRDIDTALRRLPGEQRAVLLLIALEHMSYQETAATLGIPIGTVMSRLARARERLRIMLESDAGAALKVVK